MANWELGKQKEKGMTPSIRNPFIPASDARPGNFLDQRRVSGLPPVAGMTERVAE